MTVVDASAVVELLVPSPTTNRDALLEALPEPGRPWLAPEIVVFEVFAVIRRHRLREKLTGPAAGQALHRLTRLPIELFPSGGLIGPAWRLRHNFGAADSLYVALAVQTAGTLLTADARLARAAQAAGVTTRLVS